MKYRHASTKSAVVFLRSGHLTLLLLLVLGVGAPDCSAIEREVQVTLRLIGSLGSSKPIILQSSAVIQGSQGGSAALRLAFDQRGYSRVRIRPGRYALYTDNPRLIVQPRHISIAQQSRSLLTVRVHERIGSGQKPACQRSGCSGELCTSERLLTTCEFLPHYQCFSLTECGAQSDGGRGWRLTPEFTSCLAKRIW